MHQLVIKRFQPFYRYSRSTTSQSEPITQTNKETNKLNNFLFGQNLNSRAKNCKPVQEIFFFLWIPNCHNCYQSFFFFHSPTDAQVNCVKNSFKIYIKIDIKTAPTCFGAVTPSSGSALSVVAKVTVVKIAN